MFKLLLEVQLKDKKWMGFSTWKSDFVAASRRDFSAGDMTAYLLLVQQATKSFAGMIAKCMCCLDNMLFGWLVICFLLFRMLFGW